MLAYVTNSYSYANIHCRLERPKQEVLFGDLTAPFGRKTLLRILRGLKNVEDSIQEGSSEPIVNNYREGLNANMCGTLADIVRIGLGNDLKFSANLEPIFPIPEDIRTDTSLRPSSEGYLREAEDILKGEISKEKRELSGYVFQLRRKQWEEGEKGIIKMFTVNEEGKLLPVKIKLDDEPYRLAIDAHKNEKKIRITGILEKVGSTWQLTEPECLEITDEDYESELRT